MEIKFTYTADDITAGHLFIMSKCEINHPDVGYARTVTYKIGYSNTDSGRYNLISVFTDGWVRTIGTKEEIAKVLTDEGFRPLTKSEAIRMIEDMGSHYFMESKFGF